MDDKSFSKKANISAISRSDPLVKDIILSASQVALYIFESKKGKWVKKKIEGACFFYKRKSSPKYGICILNRLDTTNFVELLNSAMDIQLQEPFILFRNTLKVIYAIWFYEESECIAMAGVFQRVLNELEEKEGLKQDDSGGDAASAAASFHDAVCAAESSTNTNSLEDNSKPNGQPDSVRQFFAKASKEAIKSQLMAIVPQPNNNKSFCSAFKSVTHIEKAQKTDHHELGLSIDVTCVGNYRHQSDIVSRVESSCINDENSNSIENHLKLMNLGPSIEEMELYSHNLLFKQNDLAPSSEFPELIPPGMLLIPETIELEADENTVASHNKVLTKNQMLDAFLYLLKNDSHFKDTLYEAYLKSSRKN